VYDIGNRRNLCNQLFQRNPWKWSSKVANVSVEANKTTCYTTVKLLSPEPVSLQNHHHQDRFLFNTKPKSSFGGPVSINCQTKSSSRTLVSIYDELKPWSWLATSLKQVVGIDYGFSSIIKGFCMTNKLLHAHPFQMTYLCRKTLRSCTTQVEEYVMLLRHFLPL